MSEPKRFTVFYSWQSDLPDSSNRVFIRQALRSAASSVEQSERGVIVEIDEATRNTSGSPNIPATILSKIYGADAFVCDITTINGGQTGRPVPNPNVVFELGYAIANIGWERAILLFNDKFGAFPTDLPFDFDRHRISKFSAQESPSEKQRKNLVDLLSTALVAVIKNNPEKPNSAESPEQTKRNRDIKNLNWVLSTLHLPTLDEYALNCSHVKTYKALYFWEDFNGVMNNSLFHLYNQKLSQLFRSYHQAFYETVRHDEYYYQNIDGSAYIFNNPDNRRMSRRQNSVYETITQAAHTMTSVMQEILEEIRTNYLEVSIDETNRKAWLSYINSNRDQTHALEDNA